MFSIRNRLVFSRTSSTLLAIGAGATRLGQQITGIQVATQESVGAIKEISGTIEKLSEISSAIAAAVDEQGAATITANQASTSKIVRKPLLAHPRLSLQFKRENP
jgi:methyl-accepting chemotaxis protein